MKREKAIPRTCPECQFSTLTEKKFQAHVLEKHETDIQTFYIKHYLSGVTPTCICGCGAVTRWWGWHTGFSEAVRGHNARVYTAFTDPDVIKQATAKRIEGYAEGRYEVWNKGLDRSTDERVKKMSEKTSAALKKGFASGKIVDWRVNNPEKAAAAAEKASKTRKQNIADGKYSPWNKGKTKNDDPRVANVSKKISQKLLQRDAGHRITCEEFLRRVEAIQDFEFVDDVTKYRRHRETRFAFKCRKCGEISNKTLAMITYTSKCFHCSPKSSAAQEEIANFIESLNFCVEKNDRNAIKPLELDVFVKSKMFAVEYHGLYWHSEKHLDKDYHERKQLAAKKNGIILFQIFEDEWRDKCDIVKSMIRHRLGLAAHKIFARKCRVKELTVSQAKEFFDKSHLDGHAKGISYFGLFSDDVCVAAMSLRKPLHKSQTGMLEIARFATAQNVAVIGAVGKLTKYALQIAKNAGAQCLMTYADTRLGASIDSYAKAGWSFIDEKSVPRFWWSDSVLRYNRFKYRANKKLGLTEQQVADAAGVKRIYGCRNLKFMIQIAPCQYPAV